MMWDIDRMKPLSATVVLSYFIYSELSPFYGIIIVIISPFYGIIREDDGPRDVYGLIPTFEVFISYLLLADSAG